MSESFLIKLQARGLPLYFEKDSDTGVFLSFAKLHLFCEKKTPFLNKKPTGDCF